MSELPDWLWERAAAARSRMLMLDYDGTLAPFQVDREHALLPRPLLALLGRLHESKTTGMAVVSGRPVAELARFLETVPVRLVGEHGWESRSPGMPIVQHPLSDASARALAWSSMVLCREPWVDRIEAKRTGLLLHTRGLPPGEAVRIETRCEKLWAPAISEGLLRLKRVTSGIELRAIGRHKGLAVRELIAASPPGTLPIYIGDDETDEDAFREVRETGIGLLVASESRPTLAIGRLGSTSEVVAFLHEWYARVEGSRAAWSPQPRQGRT